MALRNRLNAPVNLCRDKGKTMKKKTATKKRTTRHQVAPVVRRPLLKQMEQFLKPLPIDRMTLITIAGREFVSVEHLTPSPNRWTWQLEDGSLCLYTFGSRMALEADSKPSPGAKPARVRIVKAW